MCSGFLRLVCVFLWGGDCMRYRINWNRVAYVLFYVSLMSSIVLGIDSLAWLCILGIFAILGRGVSDYLTGGHDE